MAGILTLLSAQTTEASFYSSDIPESVMDTVITDATTSASPTDDPDCYIYTGYNPPYATPRSIQISWPISTPIDNTTQGTTTFSFWAKTLWPWQNPETHIYVNEENVGQVTTKGSYDWVSIDFPTSYLNQGAGNIIEIWTNTAELTAVACDAPSGDDIGETNTFYIRNNGGTATVVAPRYGEIYAQIAVTIAPRPSIQTNHTSGAPGSFFTISGTNFPANGIATIEVNTETIGTTPTDANGSFSFLLSTSNADEGSYFVTTSVNPSATVGFVLVLNESTHPQEGSGKVYDVPSGIAFTESIFLPAVLRP